MINVEWCSVCCSKPSVGTARINDGYDNLIDLGLCENCYKKIVSPIGNYSIALEG